MSTLVHESAPARKIQTKYDTKTLVTLAMLTAIAYVIMLLCQPLPRVSGFLSFDFKDTVICIGGFLYGPFAAGLLTVSVSLLQFFFGASDTGWIGLVMNILATGSFCCTASFIYFYRPTTKGAIVGLISGGLFMTVLMILWNYAITPMYMEIPRQAVVAMLVPIFLPFNLVKSGLNACGVMVLYRTVLKALYSANLVKREETPKIDLKAICSGLCFFGCFAVMALLLAGIL